MPDGVGRTLPRASVLEGVQFALHGPSCSSAFIAPPIPTWPGHLCQVRRRGATSRIGKPTSQYFRRSKKGIASRDSSGTVLNSLVAKNTPWLLGGRNGISHHQTKNFLNLSDAGNLGASTWQAETCTWDFVSTQWG